MAAPSAQAGTRVRCRSPAQNATGIAINLSIPLGRTLLGAAVFDDGGLVLRLTGAHHHSVGSCIWDMAAHPYVVHSFDLSFQMSIMTTPSTASGNGFSFSFGDIPLGIISERGAGAGLRVLFILAEQSEIQIVHGGRLLLRRNASLPVDTPRSYRISVHQSELSVVLSNTTIVARFPLAWQPQLGWRMAFGARTGAATARHEVSEIHFTVSEYFNLYAVPVEVSTNAHDYSSNQVTFAYLPEASITAISPSTGPSYGGTPLTLSGHNLRDGSDYKVLFAGVEVSATLQSNEGVDTLLAHAPSHPVGVVNVSISTNGQQFVHIAPWFGYFIQPEVSVLSPSTGPIQGGTLLHVQATLLLGGSAYVIRIGDTIVAASWNGTRPYELTCRVPSSLTPGPHSVEVSLNAYDFSSSGLNATLYDAPIVTELSPATGPLTGNTTVSVMGAHLQGGSQRLCRFGIVEVPATLMTDVAGSFLRCSTPMHLAGLVTFGVSLNGRDVSETSLQFLYSAAPLLSQLWPSIGPVRGGTVVRMTSSSFIGRGFYWVSFQDSTSPAHIIHTQANHGATIDVTTPALFPGVAHIRVSGNGQQFSPFPGSTFHVYISSHKSITSRLPAARYRATLLWSSMASICLADPITFAALVRRW